MKYYRFPWNDGRTYPVLVEIRCARKGGRCGRSTGAVVIASDDGPQLVGPRVSAGSILERAGTSKEFMLSFLPPSPRDEGRREWQVSCPEHGLAFVYRDDLVATVAAALRDGPKVFTVLPHLAKRLR